MGGSHGKTTITSMVLHVMKEAGIDTDFMVGAQLEGFDVMVRLSDTAKYMVIEGDEYLTSPIDRIPKFHKYHPHIAVISGIGWDHVNVFPTFDSYLEQFRIFINTIEKDGCLIFDNTDAEALHLAESSKVNSFGYGIHPYKSADGKTFLSLDNGDEVEVRIFGEHNMKNINAARLVLNRIGVGNDQFYKAITSFKGAARRLEKLVDNDDKGNVVFRDFAHAPSKVIATVNAIREKFPDKFFLAVFELHTYSSLSEVFIDHYASCLDNCDRAVVFYDPHAVAVKRLDMMSDERIIKGFNRDDITVVHSKEELISLLKTMNINDVVAGFMSSGDFNGLTNSDLCEIF
ncbi:MAG: Mur ligase family protein [Candidatus Limimorpha sp.]